MNRLQKSLESCPSAMAPSLKAAVTAALAAGQIIRDLADSPHQIRHKGAIDLVTEADIASEKAILAILGRQMPGIRVLAEESSSDYGAIPTGPVWLIDPLDGTTNFAHGFPHFAVSIAYSVDTTSRLGVIYCPVRDELFHAWHGGGAWLNGRPIQVSSSNTLIESLVATGFPYNIQAHLDQVIAQLQSVLPAVRDIRRAGAAALDLAYVACGRLDGFWEVDLKPWDTAAGQLLVAEAGGTVTDFKNRPWTPYTPEILASNGLIHSSLAKHLYPIA